MTSLKGLVTLDPFPFTQTTHHSVLITPHSSLLPYSPSHNLITSTHNQPERLGVELMFLLEYASRQSFFRVVIRNWNNLLRDDRATIESFRSEEHTSELQSRFGI